MAYLDGKELQVQYAGIEEVILLAETTDAVAHTVTGSWQTGFGKYREAQIALVLTDAQAAAGDTLDVYIDTSPNGVEAINICHFTQILGNGADAITLHFVSDPAGSPGTTVINATSDCASGVTRPSIFCDRLRVRYAIVDGGASGQSFTFAVIAFFKA